MSNVSTVFLVAGFVAIIRHYIVWSMPNLLRLWVLGAFWTKEKYCLYMKFVLFSVEWWIVLLNISGMDLMMLSTEDNEPEWRKLYTKYIIQRQYV